MKLTELDYILPRVKCVLSASLGQWRKALSSYLMNWSRHHLVTGHFFRLSHVKIRLGNYVIWIIALSRLTGHLPEVLGSIQKGSALTNRGVSTKYRHLGIKGLIKNQEVALGKLKMFAKAPLAVPKPNLAGMLMRAPSWGEIKQIYPPNCYSLLAAASWVSPNVILSGTRRKENHLKAIGFTFLPCQNRSP